MAAAFVYRSKELTLAELLAPGFFPNDVAVEQHQLVLLFGTDGGCMAYVAGFDRSDQRHPIIVPLSAAGFPADVTRQRKAA